MSQESPCFSGGRVQPGPAADPGPRRCGRGRRLAGADRLHRRPRSPARRSDRPERGQYWSDEPDDHAPGRSRGGLTTKIHLACDGKGRPFAILVTPGQRHDSICARPLLERIHVPALARAGRAAGPVKSSRTRHPMLLPVKQLPRLPHRSAKTWHRADHPGEDRPTTAPAEPRLPRRETTEVRPGDPPATQYDRSACSSLRSCPCIVRLLPARRVGSRPLRPPRAEGVSAAVRGTRTWRTPLSYRAKFNYTSSVTDCGTETAGTTRPRV
ncbi:transposase [Streptomyces mirabilis]|uniref:transposase n=1 Tax=Streptomyces mirabilis TaxID=68239 RepID=UPI0036A35E91